MEVREDVFESWIKGKVRLDTGQEVRGRGRNGGVEREGGRKGRGRRVRQVVRRGMKKGRRLVGLEDGNRRREVCHGRAVVRATGEDVRFAVSNARAIDDVVLVVVDHLRPASLTAAERGRRLEGLQVAMVGQNIEWRGQGLKVVAPQIDGRHHGQELFVSRPVVHLGRLHLLAHERDGVEMVIMDLGEDGGDSVVRGVGLNDGGKGRIEVAERGGRGEGAFQALKGGHAGGGEFEGDVFAEEVGERRDDARVAVHKAPVEVGEAEEGLELAHTGRRRPLEDSLDLLGRHGDTIGPYEVAQEVHRGLTELALLSFDVEVILNEPPQDLSDVSLVFGRIL